jgi:hypothetical protein
MIFKINYRIKFNNYNNIFRDKFDNNLEKL